MEVLIGTSLIAAFIAGVAALFAPCCITVLLPTYLASIFREKRAVFLMTFIFFLGLLAVFLPLGLSAGWLGQVLSQYHDLIFIGGSIFLLFLGSSILLGKHYSLPFSVNRGTKITNAGSVFGLGVFSGLATLCCAPVLAGVLALSVLSASMLWGGLYSIAYVLGMVVPLFILAYFLDRKQFSKKFMGFKKQVSYGIAGKDINITLANLISGLTFLIMGILIAYLAATNQLISHSSSQLTFNIYTATFTSYITNLSSQLPEFLWVLLFVAMFALVIIIAFYKLHSYTSKG